MKIKAHAFALASTIVTTGMYALATILIKVFPSSAFEYAAPLFHLDRLKLVKYLKPFFAIRPINFAIALAEISIYTYVSSFILIVLYNLFAGYYRRGRKE
ncbi:MAG TPA: hypothetical protein PLU71_01010 [Candidatus Dependentiae bacterium]|nr:hypothetical protein [Candidatus Dependentiae bacterium]HRQ62413.1 hypothetical protein [Candidatus Dependentiae bacterium]